MKREDIAGYVIEHAAALYRVEKYERRLIDAMAELDAPEDKKRRFLAAAGVGDMDGYCMAEAIHLLYELMPEGGAK